MASSSQTTEILFNSPALHSLKRDQLVKLCKIHSIKASGKNVELIERLKKVAENLPKGAPLSIAARSDMNDSDNMEVDGKDDEDKENSFGSRMDKMDIPRPSEQWTVMESIAEADNESGGSRNGTLKSLGSNREFGTGGSKSSTVSSSIKALASSLGLKRSTSAKSALSTTTYDSLTSLQPPPVPPMPVNSSSGNLPLTAHQDELSKTSTPYASIPAPSPSQMPQTDHFSDFSHFNANPPTASTLSKFDFTNREDNTPLPGHVLRPGMPAPENARLSLGNARFSIGIGSPRKSTSGPTTTIRLVSSSSMTGPEDSPEPSTSIFGFSNENEHGDTPRLKPLHTAFDLVLGSPNQGENVKIYPDLPVDDLVMSPSPTKSKSPMPGSLSSLPQLALPLPTPTSSNAKPEPFIFGSPLPQHRVSDAQFKSAAASVLEEMNRRLLADGVDTVGTTLISTLRPGAAADLSPNTKKAYTDREIKPLRKNFGVKSKFERAHQDQFSGMESIAGYLDRKNKIGPSPSRKGPGAAGLEVDDDDGDDDNEPVQVGKKRKSNVLGEGRPGQAKRPSTRVISNSRRKIPGGFGDDDDDEGEEEDAPTGKKARVEFSQTDATVVESKVKAKEEATATERTEKEREAIRRKLEMNRARRRSSAANGRASMGRGRASVSRNSVLHKPPPKPVASKSRFGFLSSAAKSLVKGVWGGSKKASEPAPARVSTTKPVPVAASSTTAGASDAKGKLAPPPSGVQRKVSVASSGPVKPSTSGTQVSSTSSRASHARNVSNSGTMTSLASVAATIHSARSRSPLPSFAAPTRSSSIRTSSSAGVMSTRNSSVASRVTGSSSGGTAASRSSFAPSSRVSSIGTRGSLSRPGGSTVPSTSSRLLAPTASSLAKTATLNKLKSNTLNVPTTKPLSDSSPSTSNSNPSPNVNTNTNASPAPGKIFSKPLVVPIGSGLPSPVRSGSSQTVPTKSRSLSGRKPRISRSKVIAKLASQRTASGSSSSGHAGGSGSGSGSGSGPSSSAAVNLAAKRSSLGVGVHKAPRKSVGGARRSHVGVTGARSSEVSVLLSAKKRARQSEYVRRKSRVGGGSSIRVNGASGTGSDAMGVSS
ncbi:hypothetical protein GYMLUDRAFT_260864 [Collybiopsis luxurians FD-317 M1]|uniref:SAP domain-containing protein n=1 Tax=Collybiopsis luxurians FD-317 M1 TaxID=944289 RepID=A0A0D0BC93_9AGAR|nr:hypothetical protein GYMLUDRAFT_260864 [Collybiopsis luxurians FD-317 M1]